MLNSSTINVDNKEIKLSNKNKLLWENLGITKIEYIKILYQISPYIIKYSQDRLLTTIRYPDGIKGKSFYQKNMPQFTPKWVDFTEFKNIKYINLNKTAVLIWLCNLAALEFHISFNNIKRPDSPEYLLFDLDPPVNYDFKLVCEASLKINEALKSLGISSIPKTSGATGIQIIIPTQGLYQYDKARKINHFFGKYFSEKYPNIFSIERIVKNRNKKIYFDYLQMWYGKTIIAPYSPRATNSASVSVPLNWVELEQGISPEDFNLLNITKRLDKKGDILSEKLTEKNDNIQEILKNI